MVQSLKLPSSTTSGEITAPHSELYPLPMGPRWEPTALLGALTLEGGGFCLALCVLYPPHAPHSSSVWDQGCRIGALAAR